MDGWRRSFLYVRMPAVVLAMLILSLTFSVTSFAELVALIILVGGPLLVYLFAVQTRVISVVGLLAVGGYVWWAHSVLNVDDDLEALGLSLPGWIEALGLPLPGWIGACSLVALDLCLVFFSSTSRRSKQHPS